MPVAPTSKMLLSVCSVLAWAGGWAGILTDSWQLCQPIWGKLRFWKNVSTNDRQIVWSCHSVDNIEWQILKSVPLWAELGRSWALQYGKLKHCVPWESDDWHTVPSPVRTQHKVQTSTNTSERRCVTIAGLSEIVSSILGAGWLAGETNNPYW